MLACKARDVSGVNSQVFHYLASWIIFSLAQVCLFSVDTLCQNIFRCEDGLMVIGIIIFFAFIWILVAAFSSGKKEIHVRTVDAQTGNETLEIRHEVGGSIARTAARTTLWIIFGIFAFLVGVAILSHFMS